MAGVIQGLHLNFIFINLFNGACMSNIEFVLSKKDSMDRLTSCWSN